MTSSSTLVQFMLNNINILHMCCLSLYYYTKFFLFYENIPFSIREKKKKKKRKKKP